MTRTLTIGDVVAWPSSPSGLAQVDELRRKKVRLVYRTKGGKFRYATVSVAELCGPGPLFEMKNLFGRAAFPRTKTFNVPAIAGKRGRDDSDK